MLGLANNGNVLAMWTIGKNQATFEHLGDDRVRWFVSLQSPEGPDTAAGITNVQRLDEIVGVQGIRALIDGEG